MNDSYFRILVTGATLFFVSMMSAWADSPISGKVTGVSQNAHTFTVHYFVTVPGRHGGVNSDRKSGREQVF
jgi:hypothetical protein